jgi:hypothetical protein
MRIAVILGIVVVLVAPAAGQRKDTPPARYGIEADLEGYPQDTPKAALSSVLRAIDARRYDYLAAQLADPDEVDKRVRDLGGKFEAYLKLITDRFAADPEAIRELRRFLSDGEVNESGDAATFSLKTVKGRQVFLRKANGRWFLQDRQKPAKPNP